MANCAELDAHGKVYIPLRLLLCFGFVIVASCKFWATPANLVEAVLVLEFLGFGAFFGRGGVAGLITGERWRKTVGEGIWTSIRCEKAFRRVVG